METKAETANDGWQVTAKRYVAFIDIMGFKDMVLKNSHEEIYEIMQRIDESKKKNEAINWLYMGTGLVKSTSYSDSIIVYSKDDTYNSLNSIICTVAGITNDLFKHCIPHKGAFASGKITLDYQRSIFFGQPLIDAYLLQEELYFYGIVIHASAEKYIKAITRSEKLPPFISDYYPCPLKNGNPKHLTIFPTYSSSEGKKDFFEEHNKVRDSINQMRYKTSGHLRKYIDNTETYFDHVKGLDWNSLNDARV